MFDRVEDIGVWIPELKLVKAVSFVILLGKKSISVQPANI
jgi:hypothetical protein